MTAKKRLSIITFIISILAFIAALYSNLRFLFWYDISLAILGSALLGFIMSLTEYFAEKRKAMEAFWDEAIRITNLLNKAKYYLPDEPPDIIRACIHEAKLNEWCDLEELRSNEAKEALISYCKDSIHTNANNADKNEAAIDDWYRGKIQDYEKQLNECMDSYIHLVNSFDLGNLSNYIGNMDFLFANNTIRKSAYDDIYDSLKKIRKEIVEKVYHFKLAKTGEGLLTVCVGFLLELNDFVFTTNRSTTDNHETIIVYRKLYDTLHDNIEIFRAKIYRQKPNFEKHIAILQQGKVINEAGQD